MDQFTNNEYQNTKFNLLKQLSDSIFQIVMNT